jgi:hypothetical protein
MTDNEKVFRYKLDFYYQSALIYLVTLILYGAVRGNIGEGRFEIILLGDPLMYVIVFFVLMAFATLALNLIRNRRLIVSRDALVFTHRFHERVIPIQEIEWMHVGREMRVQTGGRFQVVVFKLKNRRRLFRIRIGRYERDEELLTAMKYIAGTVPKRKPRRWRKKAITDR